MTAPTNTGEATVATPVVTVAETRNALIDRSGRAFTPIAKSFVQNPDRTAEERRGPLAEFVNKGDKRGLLALLMLHTAISSGKDGWGTTLPLAVWARVFATTENAEAVSANAAASKVLRRLEERHLIERHQSGRPRKVTVTLLAADGSGESYTRPTGSSAATRFLRLSHRFWTQEWDTRLSLPGIAMLLVSLHEKPGFALPTEHMPTWYGWSSDTAERGLGELRHHGLLHLQRQFRMEPLSPTGLTTFNEYTLQAPFDPTTVDQDIAAMGRKQS